MGMWIFQIRRMYLQSIFLFGGQRHACTVFNFDISRRLVVDPLPPVIVEICSFVVSQAGVIKLEVGLEGFVDSIAVFP